MIQNDVKWAEHHYYSLQKGITRISTRKVNKAKNETVPR